MAAFFGILGRVTDRGMNNANLDNLQVVDADLNDFKGKVSSYGASWVVFG